MLFYWDGNHPDISVACGDSSISVGSFALNNHEKGLCLGLESPLPQILVNASLASASCRRDFDRRKDAVTWSCVSHLQEQIVGDQSSQ